MGNSSTRPSSSSTAATAAKREPRHYKVLLLGAGDSGKSTLVKQMAVINKGGFSKEVREAARPAIYQHVLSSMAALVRATATMGGAVSRPDQAKRIVDAEESGAPATWAGKPIPKEVARDIHELWSRDPAIKRAWQRAGELQVPESVDFFFDSIGRMADDSYLPTDQDIVMSPSRTTGFSSVEYRVDSDAFEVVDVGGQRSERRKWIQTFSNVNAVVFCTALSEYNMTLYEDHLAPRLEESLRLFKDICSSPWFTSSEVFLFLQKRDVFAKKIKSFPLANSVPEFKGPADDIEAAARFIRDLFVSMARGRRIHCFFTTATDSRSIRSAFLQLQEIVRKSDCRGKS